MSLILGNYKQADGVGTDYHGCTLERSPEDIGTIVGYMAQDKVYRHFLVLNAEYWPTTLLVAYKTGFYNSKATAKNVGSEVIADKRYAGNVKISSAVTTETLQSNLCVSRYLNPKFMIANSLLSINTTIINNSVPLKYCYNLDVAGHGTKYATIPNWLQAANIWLIWDELIKLDPTYTEWLNKQKIQTNTAYKSYRTLNAALMSCDQDTIKECAHIDNDGKVDTSGGSFLVIPIHELD
ncbi:MAG: hypothetical protein IJU79_02785 [Desulfovibrionaceae bacterium]|nr:hypothetical protein [Desulfovibrionaceae bacterium]